MLSTHNVIIMRLLFRKKKVSKCDVRFCIKEFLKNKTTYTDPFHEYCKKTKISMR